MKTFVLLLCALSFPSLATEWQAELGTLPSASGQSPRYQIIQGSIIDNKGNQLPQTIRLDTWTGETWTLANVGAQTWTTVPESDSPLLRQIREAQANKSK